MSKPIEFWIDAGNGAHTDLASAECSDPDFISDIIHVIEKSAYEALEEKLRVAVELLTKIQGLVMFESDEDSKVIDAIHNLIIEYVKLKGSE